jgi:N utilization substance protein B
MAGKKFTRHEVREGAFLLLYQAEIMNAAAPESLDEILADCAEAFGFEINTEMQKLARGVLENKDALDLVIAKYSATRKPERLPKINLTIIRMGIYEMDFQPEIPDKVAINEAIELSKEYAYPPDTKLISGLLGSYFREKQGQNDERE